MLNKIKNYLGKSYQKKVALWTVLKIKAKKPEYEYKNNFMIIL